MTLPDDLELEFERRLTEVFLESARESGSADFAGARRRTVRAMVRAAFELAFEDTDRREAVAMLAEVLSELNAKHNPSFKP